MVQSFPRFLLQQNLQEHSIIPRRSFTISRPRLSAAHAHRQTENATSRLFAIKRKQTTEITLSNRIWVAMLAGVLTLTGIGITCAAPQPSTGNQQVLSRQGADAWKARRAG